MRFPQAEIILWIGSTDLALEAWLDTGFEGGVSLPAAIEHDIIADAYDAQVRVADGRVLTVPAWPGMVEIGGRSFACEVIAVGSRVLLGLEVLKRMDVLFATGAEVRFRFKDGHHYSQSYP